MSVEWLVVLDFLFNVSVVNDMLTALERRELVVCATESIFLFNELVELESVDSLLLNALVVCVISYGTAGGILGLILLDGEMELLGDTELEIELLGDTELDGETELLIDDDGETELEIELLGEMDCDSELLNELLGETELEIELLGDTELDGETEELIDELGLTLLDGEMD